MRAEGRAFCSDSWYLLAGVLLQKRRTSLPSKRKASTPPDTLTRAGRPTEASPLANTVDLLDGASNGHSSSGHRSSGHSANGHSANGHGANGHSTIKHSANGHTISSHGFESGVPQQNGAGDCSGLRHRYSTDANGAVNAAEDQLDELIQVMTALR